MIIGYICGGIAVLCGLFILTVLLHDWITERRKDLPKNVEKQKKRILQKKERRAFEYGSYSPSMCDVFNNTSDRKNY